MKNWYKSLESRYRDFDPSFQILNMVSDLEKARHFEGTDSTLKNNHLYRAIILLD